MISETEETGEELLENENFFKELLINFSND